MFPFFTKSNKGLEKVYSTALEKIHQKEDFARKYKSKDVTNTKVKTY